MIERVKGVAEDLWQDEKVFLKVLVIGGPGFIMASLRRAAEVSSTPEAPLPALESQLETESPLPIAA